MNKSRERNQDRNFENVGKPLRDLRRAAGLTQVELSEALQRAGFTTASTTISNWERGYARPPLNDKQFIDALAAAFRISHDDLMIALGLIAGDATYIRPDRARFIEALDRGDWPELMELIIQAARQSDDVN